MSGTQRQCEAYNCINFAVEFVDGGSFYCRYHARNARSLHPENGRHD